MHLLGFFEIALPFNRNSLANAEGGGVRLRADCYRRCSLSSRSLSSARLSGQVSRAIN